MTTRRTAEALLFEKPEDVIKTNNVALPETVKTVPMGNKTQMRTMVPNRRRVCATYCPICAGWVEVRLRPVRLHCTVCGLEARP